MGWADAQVIEEPPTKDIPAWMQALLVDTKEEFGPPESERATPATPVPEQIVEQFPKQSPQQPPRSIEPPAEPPPQRVRYGDNKVAVFPHDTPVARIERTLRKATADQRELTPEEVEGRSLWTDSAKHEELRQSTEVRERGREEYAEFFSGKDADGKPVMVKPEEITPQALAEAVESRKKLTAEAANDPNTDPVALREFKEDTTAIERDLGRMWSDETTYEFNRRRLIARGEAPIWSRPTPSASARDRKILEARAEAVPPGEQVPIVAIMAKNVLEGLRKNYGEKFSRGILMTDRDASMFHRAVKMLGEHGKASGLEDWIDKNKDYVHTKDRSGNLVTKVPYEPTDLASAILLEYTGGTSFPSTAEYWAKRVPGLGEGYTTRKLLDIKLAQMAEAKGTASVKDLREIAHFLKVQEEEGKKGWVRSVADVATMLPALAIEYWATGGVYAAAKGAAEGGILKGGMKLAGEGVKRGAVIKATTAIGSRIVGAGAQAAASPMVVSSVMRRMVPEFGLKENEQGQLKTIIEKQGDGFAEALPRGFYDAWVEMVTERAGGRLMQGLGLTAMKGAIARRWLSQSGRSIPGLANRLLTKGGWHGIIGESLEERAGEIMRGVVPGQEKDFGATGDIFAGRWGDAAYQISMEAAAFLPFTAAAAIPSRESRDHARLAGLKADLEAGGWISRKDGEVLKKYTNIDVTKFKGPDAQKKRTEAVKKSGILEAIQKQEAENAQAVPSPEKKVREAEGGPDLRGVGRGKVGEEPAGEGVAARAEEEVRVAPVAPEAVVEPAVAKPALEPAPPTETPPAAPEEPAAAPKKPLGVKKVKPAKQPPAAREPWEMTLAEYRQTPRLDANHPPPGQPWGDSQDAIRKSEQRHHIEVELAIEEGKPVPPEVLADYPDLAPKKPKPGAKKAKPAVQPPAAAVEALKPLGAKPKAAPPADTKAPETPQDKAAATKVIKEEERAQGQEDAASGVLSREAIKYAPLDTLPEPVRLAMKQWAEGWLQNLPVKSKRRPALEKIVKDAGLDKGAAVENEKERMAKEAVGYVPPIRRDKGLGEQGRGYKEPVDLRDPIGQAIALEPEERDVVIDKSVVSIRNGKPDDLATRMQDLIESESAATFAVEEEVIDWLESLRDQPQGGQRTIFGTTEATTEELEPGATTEEPEPRVKQGVLFSKAGLTGQQNLFPDTGVPDSMVQPAAPEGKEGYGASNKLVTQSEYEKERENIRRAARGEKLLVGIDPSLLKSAVKIGLYHLEAGTRSFAEWSARMVADFGETIRDNLPKLWNRIKKRLDSAEPLTEEEIQSIAREVGGAQEPVTQPKPLSAKEAIVIEEEKPPRPEMTGIKKAALEQQHAAMGLAPPNPAESVKAIGLVEDAIARLTPESDKAIQERAAAVIANPRLPITLEEAADFLASVDYHRTRADAAEDRYNELMAKGEDAAATAAEAEANTHKAAMNNAGQAARLMGSQWAFMGHIYQLLVDKDGKAHIERLLRSANQGQQGEGDAEWAEELAGNLEKVKKRQAARGKKVDEANAKRRVNEKKAEVEDEIRRERQRSKRRRGSKNRVFTQEAKDAAVQRISDRLKASQQGTVYAAPIPQLAGMLKDAAIVAGYHVEAGARRLAEFSREMVNDLGDWVKPHLDDLYRTARAEYARIQQEEIGGRLADADDLRGQHRTVKQLAKEILAETRKEDGSFIHREELLDLLHSELKKIDPDITRRETMDLFGGTPRTELSKDDLEVAYRDRHGETRELTRIDDLLQKKTPSPMGQEMHTPSDEERQLHRQVRDLKKAGERDGWYHSGENKLKGTLDSQKTRLQNEIRDIDSQIADGTKIEQEKRVPLTDAELEILRDIRNERKQVYDDVFGVPGLTDEQRAERYERHLERQIEKIREQLATGKVFPETPTPPPKGPRIRALKAELEAVQAEKNLIRKVLDPNYETNKKIAQAEKQAEREVRRLEEEQAKGFKMKDKPVPLPETERLKKARAKLRVLREQRQESLEDEYALKAAIAQSKRNIANIRDKLARGDFAKKNRKEPRVWDDPEWQEAKLEEQGLREKLAEKIAEYEWQNMDSWQTTGFYAKRTAVLWKAIMTGFDLTAQGLQLGISMVTNPVVWSKALIPTFKSISVKKRKLMDAEIESHPDWERYKGYGVALREHGRSSDTVSTEFYGNDAWIDKIPGAAVSERTFSTAMNHVRFNLMRVQEWAYTKDGRTLSQEQGEAIARIVNTFTLGYKPPKHGHKRRVVLSAAGVVFWAPSMYVARAQLLVGAPVLLNKGADSRVRMMAAKQYIKAIVGVSALVAALRMLLGDDEERDLLPGDEKALHPTDPDFWKVKVGDKRMDMTSGMGQMFTFAARLLNSATAARTGSPIWETKGRQLGARELFGSFSSFKVNPWISAGFDIASEKDVVGRPTSVGNTLLSNITPLSVQTVIESIEDSESVAEGMAWSVPGVTGRNLTIYDRTAPKSEETFLATAKRLIRRMIGKTPTGLSEGDMEKWLEGIKWDYDVSKAEKFLTPEQMKQVEDRREEKRRSVVAAATQAEPDRKKHKNDKTYRESIEERKKAKETFREMKAGLDLTRDEALQLLEDYYAYKVVDEKTGEPVIATNEEPLGTFLPSYDARKEALEKLYSD